MSDKSLQEWLDTLPAAAYTCDPEGLITGYNGRAVKLWGQAPQLNNPKYRYCGSFQILAADGAPLPPENYCMARVLRTGEECTGSEITFQRKDGQLVYALLNASVLRDGLGRLVGGIGVLVEIGKQKEAFEKLEKEIAVYKKTEALIHESNERGQYLLMHILHEDIGQQITGIALLVGILQKSLAKESHPLAKKAAELSMLTSACISISSNLAKGFYPLDIEVEGFMTALECLAQRTEAHFKISCKALRDESCQFPKKDSIHLYRIVEIAILRAVQNCGAKKIVVECSMQEGVPTVKITHYATKQKQHPRTESADEIDLLNSRARLIGASIEIRDEPGNGSSLICRLRKSCACK